MGAPPTRAAIVPSATRHKSETPATTGTNVVAGATRIVTTGTPAPTANVTADASAACNGQSRNFVGQAQLIASMCGERPFGH